ncbi:MAG TPA: hypothetical protein VMU95_30760 [Trebonia sp.]|nr:hypothetical protein [Trebonia sp.]
MSGGCIGGPFALKPGQIAPERVGAAVLEQPAGSLRTPMPAAEIQQEDSGIPQR